MNCDRCGQRVNEVPECEHPMLWVESSFPFPDTTHVKCAGCSKDFGPVRELISAKSDAWRYAREIEKGCALESDLRAQVATLTRERDEAVKERDEARQQWREAVDCLDTWKGIADAARARIAELEKVPMSTTITLNSNGTWEGRKV